jgi:death on curing protein
MKKEVVFLTLAEVIEIHNDQIVNYGGDPGVRDINLLSSALAMPESTFDGSYLHADFFAMAAAYAFHICQNHPFVDANKRVALVSALVFLDYNGIDIDDPKEKLYALMMKVAKGKGSKKEIEDALKELADT